MIKAEHTAWARLVFNPYADRLLRKHFGHFYTLNECPPIDREVGLVIAPNHFSWWDGFFIDYINRKLIQRTIYMMMLERQLKRYRFFRKLGAYSINPENMSAMAESIEYTRKIIRNPENLAVIFPQGEIQPYDKRPVVLKRGIQLMVNGVELPTYILPAAVKIQFGNERYPDVYCRFGELVESRILQKDFASFKRDFIDNLDRLDQGAYANSAKYNLFGKER